MIASLPMYDWPEVRWATDALWLGMRQRVGGPPDLQRGADHHGPWKDTDLLFSQTCGYPFTHGFRGQLKLVATPHYAVDGASGPYYQSLVMARQDMSLSQFRGGVAAVNAADSMSGMLALKLVFAPLAVQGQFFGRSMMTGGHAASLEAVRDGVADVCAVDAICMAMARRYRPALLQGLVEVARSPLVPGLPFVTRAGDVEALQQALQEMMVDPDLATARAAMFLAGCTQLTVQDYDQINLLEAAMEKAGGLAL